MEREATGTELQGAHRTRRRTRSPDEQREVFLMREIANLPFKEIAEDHRRAREHREEPDALALERLQEHLSEYEDYARALR